VLQEHYYILSKTAHSAVSHNDIIQSLMILGAFAKLRKVTISFVVSVCLFVCPSARTEQVGSHWTDFHET